MSSPTSPPNPVMDAETRAVISVVIVTFHALILIKLGLRRRCSRHPALRFILWSVSAAYLPLISYVLSYLTDILWYMDSVGFQGFLLVSVVLLQFLKDKADMEALAVAAVASPVAGDDDVNSLKVRPTMVSLVYSVWVAGLIVYNIFFGKPREGEKQHEEEKRRHAVYYTILLVVSPLWALGACRMVLKFVAFHRATGSFALGRNVQLMDGYMGGQLQEADDCLLGAVPRLIVTGERKRDIERSAQGYRIKRSALGDEDEASSLVTLDRVWSESETLLVPQLKDLCLSFALFKCLRRRFAGCRRLTEVGSSWAFQFVRDGLLGREDDHERIFRVIASELTFARDFYYSPLPVASLGSLYAGLHFFFSVLIFSYLCLLLLPFVYLTVRFCIHSSLKDKLARSIVINLPTALSIVLAWTEMSEIIASVRSNWTKISIVGHYIRCRNRWARRILRCLLGRCKSPKQWKDEIGQIELSITKPTSLLGNRHSWTRFIKQRQNHVIQIPLVVKAAILTSFRSSGGQLSAGTAAVQRRRQAFCHDITWACLGGEQVTTATDAILVWWVATGLFEIRRSSRQSSPLSFDERKATDDDIDVAVCLSRYCAYVVAKAPDLLPDNAAWTECRYKEVTKDIEAALLLKTADLEAGAYGYLLDHFGSELSHEVLKKGSRLGRQLVEEAEKQGPEGGEEKVWKLLAEFWSEMLPYLAPSDNVKAHIQVLQRGGELITLLWVLLLHAGITSRPAPHTPEP